MPKNLTKATASAKAAARNTDSSASSLDASASNDPAALKGVHTNDLALAMPFNVGKPLEYGFENGLTPQPGATVEPQSRLPGGSTLSEENGTAKTGSYAPEGIIMADGDIHSALELFIKGVQDHRHPMRETDPRMV